MVASSKQSDTLLNFTTAGLGGIFAWIIVHPFNTAAIQMNLNAASGKLQNQSFASYLSTTVKERGILSLYKGLSAGILRQTFYATSRFGLFEVIRDFVAKYRETDLLSRLLSGCISGGMAAIISCPAEVTLVRMSNDQNLPLDQRRNYRGVVNAFQRIMSEEGPATFFRGSMPFVNRAMLVGAVQVGTYDQFKVWFNTLGVKEKFSNVFCASMTSGLLYSLVTMPFETAKNRMASQKPDPATGQLLYKGTIQTISLIAKTNGPLQLWQGFLPYYLRCGGHTVFMFVAVEYLRNTYKKYAATQQ